MYVNHTGVWDADTLFIELYYGIIAEFKIIHGPKLTPNKVKTQIPQILVQDLNYRLPRFCAWCKKHSNDLGLITHLQRCQ